MRQNLVKKFLFGTKADFETGKKESELLVSHYYSLLGSILFP